jgi:mannose-6-phosphate isomerase-like protein (cupin superfamily)
LEVIRSKQFTADKAWGAKDQPYKWHVNDGEEVFAVMDGTVEMLYKENNEVKSATLNAGDIFFASIGTEHVAHPKGQARILVVEREGSV